MIPLTEIFAELNFVTDRISTQVRTIALSVLALVWVFLAGGHNAPTLPNPPSNRELLWVALIAVGALVADYLQYLLGYLATNAVRDKADAAGAKEAEYSYTDVRYRARGWCFWLKQVLAIAAVVWLGLIIGRSLVGSTVGAS